MVFKSKEMPFIKVSFLSKKVSLALLMFAFYGPQELNTRFNLSQINPSETSTNMYENLLYDLKQKHNFSYLFISHDLSVVEHFCDNIMVLYFGKLVEYGVARDVFDQPKESYTKELIASIPSLKIMEGL